MLQLSMALWTTPEPEVLVSYPINSIKQILHDFVNQWGKELQEALPTTNASKGPLHATRGALLAHRMCARNSVYEK